MKTEFSQIQPTFRSCFTRVSGTENEPGKGPTNIDPFIKWFLVNIMCNTVREKNKIKLLYMVIFSGKTVQGTPMESTNLYSHDYFTTFTHSKAFYCLVCSLSSP